MQKIIKKNIKNNISFSINNYNSNNSHSREYDDIYKNINNNPKTICMNNKSIDLSRNKSPIFPPKRNYLLKTEIDSDLKNKHVSMKEPSLIENNRSVDFTKKDLNRINNLYHNNENINLSGNIGFLMIFFVFYICGLSIISLIIIYL